jgi:hypothetical protein
MKNLHTKTPSRLHGRAGAVYLDPTEFHQLKESWAVLVASSDHRNREFDPVVSLRRTGALIAAVERVITTAETREEGHGMDGGGLSEAPGHYS